MEKRPKKSNHLSPAVRTFFNRGAIVYFAVGVAALFLLCALCAGWLTPYDPNKNVIAEAVQGPSMKHIFGTDEFGRDVLTRLIYGSRISLASSLMACGFAAISGMLLGLLSGYYEGAVGRVILRYVDLQLSIPPLLFTIIIGMFLGKGLTGLIIALGFGLIPSFVRLMHSQVLAIKNSDFITALRLGNIGDWQIIFNHLLPNTLAPMITMFAMNLGTTVMLESTISFLGIGIQQPTASWGNMVADGEKFLFTSPLLCILPGVCVVLLTVAFNIIGDSLADALDPRLRGKL